MVVCAYTQARWDALGAAVDAAHAQLGPGDELVLVVDHEPALLARLRDRARDRWPAARVVASTGAPGLSGARNTGVTRSTADVVVFLDDDAVPRPGWLGALRARFVSGTVSMVGGAVEPAWETGTAPRWFPDELGWVVGCDYRGLPGDGEPIRNPIGASMAAARAALDAAGPFSEDLGRAGTLPAGCEETEMGIRVHRALPDRAIVRDTSAVVDHAVPAARASVRYVVRRCWHEGRSKAALARAVGASGALSSERSYALRMVTSGTARRLGEAVRGDAWALARAGVALLGLGVTTAGYVAGHATARRRPAEHGVGDRSASRTVADPVLGGPGPRAGRAPIVTAPVEQVVEEGAA